MSVNGSDSHCGHIKRSLTSCSVGALIAAGITLGTGQWQSTWAWRAPSLFQGIFSLLCIIILPFM